MFADETRLLLQDAFSKGVCSVLREIEEPTPQTILGVSFGDDDGNAEV